MQRGVRTAAEFLAGLAADVMDGDYDDGFEPEVAAVVYRREGSGKATVAP